MNKLFLIPLITLTSCGSYESYNQRANSVITEITTDSLIQISKKNINKLLSKTKHEHSYSDSVISCLDSIKHELELKDRKLKQAQRVQREEVPIVRVAEMYKVEALEVVEATEMKLIQYQPDTVFIYDTIYIDSCITVNDTITELMSDSEKKKLNRKRNKE